MNNNYLRLNIKSMNKSIAYRNVLNLSEELGINLPNIRRQWVGSTVQYWRNELSRLQREINNRTRNYNQALRISREIREPLQLSTNVRGTNYSDWRREVRRLQMRARRAPQRIALIQANRPLLKSIRQPNILAQTRVRQRNEAIRNELIQRAIQTRYRLQFDRLINQNNFQSIFDIVVNDNQLLTERQANRLYNNIITSGRFNLTITLTDRIQHLPVNETTKVFIIHILTNGTFIDRSIENFGSDLLDNIEISNISRIIITPLQQPNRVIRNRDGQFFAYINTLNIDLSKYQIYNQEQAYNNVIKEHCLLHTFLECGVKKSLVNQVKLTYIEGHHIRKSDIKKIATIIKKNINIHSIRTCGKIDVTKIKGGVDDEINMAIYENHYFVYEKIKYEGTKTNSLSLIDRLFREGHFKKLDFVKFQEASSNKDTKEHIYLDNIQNEQTEMKEKEEKEKEEEPNDIYYADCETFVNGENHELYLIGLVSNKNDCVSILSVCDKIYQENTTVNKKQLVVNSFLHSITRGGKQKALCYLHNLKYDYHVLEPYLNVIKRCEKDNQIYNVIIKYKTKEVELRDSFKIIPFALHKFQKEFNLPKEYGKKEAIAYKYYTEENDNKIIPTSEYIKLLSNEEQEIFKKEINKEPSYNFDNKTFNPTEYYKDYLRLDCLVLKKGIQKFNQLIEEITEGKMNVFDCLTISSLTDKYMIKKGAYKGVFNTTGNLRAYIAKAVYGGRVNVNEKYKKQVINGKIADYDGVSLYPSAINRLCREKGLPIGKATRFENGNFNWQDKTYSIMTVKITKVNKHQQMPFIANKTKTSIEYTNEPPPKEIVIDSITLEDYIKFHHIEYEILDGVYWNNGGNNKMGEVVQSLFEARLKYKVSNTVLANVIKLMLNSSYGKTIMKKTQTETKIIKTNYKTYNEKTESWNTIEKTPFKDYIYNNFHTIKSWRKINNNCYEVERVCADNSSNRGHIGCAILSMSKRIMNEVFDVANDNELPIYYTDTDSIHMNYNDVPKLEKEYKIRYNKELNGKYLEQFHTDFNLDGAGKDYPIYATKSIFLGKKSYLDVLESKDKDGNTINGFHIRLKGITEEGLLQVSKKYKDSYLGLYTDLAKGIEKDIILNPFNEEENKQKVLFEFKDGTVSTRKEFIRKVKF